MKLSGLSFDRDECGWTEVVRGAFGALTGHELLMGDVDEIEGAAVCMGQPGFTSISSRNDHQ